MYCNIMIDRDDYVSGPYTVTFPMGMTKVTLDVGIKDDRLLESTEIFQLTISSNTLPNRVTTTNPSEVNVPIVDNDGKLLILYII